MPEKTKQCTCCLKTKLLEQFYKRGQCGREASNRFRSHCKECCSLKAAVRWNENEDFRHRGKSNSYKHILKKNYGLTEEDYLSMYKEQDGLCAICKQKNYNKAGRLAVDHCHVTGKVCGLLCTKCNAGIGLLGDSVQMLKVAISYLEHHKNG